MWGHHIHTLSHSLSLPQKKNCLVLYNKLCKGGLLGFSESESKPSQAKPSQAAHELPKGSTTKAAHYFVLVQFLFPFDGRIFFIQKMWRKMNLLTSSMIRYREGKFIVRTSTFGLKFSSLLLLLMTMRPKRVSKNNTVKYFRTSYCASHNYIWFYVYEDCD